MLTAPTHSAGSTRDTDTNTYEGTQVYTHDRILWMASNKKEKVNLKKVGGVILFFQGTFFPSFRASTVLNKTSPSSGDVRICLFISPPSEGDTAVSAHDTD